MFFFSANVRACHLIILSDYKPPNLNYSVSLFLVCGLTLNRVVFNE